MPLAAGTRLGPYEIVEPIGKGGMGEVYRARDTKLERDVAIKVLPDELAGDEERVARFEREARLLASLNHPNIAGIYGFESNALVLELVEGPTLADLIEQGRLPVDEVLAITKQIAEALEAGHEAGIIHRDLKPANIKVKDDGTVKVLDYGLAKALEADATELPDSELSQSPTLTRQGTQIGVILGTAAYMSPEQAKGKRVDKRTDIWAFGAVVYEMLTGLKAFDGATAGEILAAVIKDQPDLSTVPLEERRLLDACLQKNPNERLRDIGDAWRLLEGSDRENPAQPSSRVRLPWLIAGLSAIVALIAVYRFSGPVETPRAVGRFSLQLPPGDSITWEGYSHALALSPDGTRLVYRANQRLYLRAMDDTVATLISGSEGARGSPTFSPDGEWIVFHANGELKKIAVQGGSPVRLCDAGFPFGIQWTPEDKIVFAQRGAGILRVSAAGGEEAEVVVEIADLGEVAQGPRILPGGDAVLFTLASEFDHLASGDAWNRAKIVVASLETGQRQIVVDRGRDAHYLPTGHLVYVLDGTLLAVPFDLGALEARGGPVPVAENIMTGRAAGAAHYSISNNGTLAYMPLSHLSNTLVWVDRQGREQMLSAEPRAYQFPSISPDGNRLAVTIGDPNMDIWIWDFTRETRTQLTYTDVDVFPVWSRDGQRVAFTSLRDGSAFSYWQAADGTGSAERLTGDEPSRFPSDFTPDGSRLLFTTGSPSRARVDADVGMSTLDGASEPVLQSEAVETAAVISPDGRWIAYNSDESGLIDVFVRPFPDVDQGQWQISHGGGGYPRWSADGSELFYWAFGEGLTAVEVQTNPSFATGKSEVLFGGYYVPMTGRNYDVAPDGERFLMIKKSVGSDSADIVVVVNWFTELERLVPIE